jgi:RNA polymerase sigma-70 factor (ECF subfamily)
MALASGDLDLARDATDEAFARALERWDDVGAMASPGGWTYRVAINVARRRQRRAALERRLLARHTTPPAVPEAARELWDVVRSLPYRQRLVVVLRYVADLPQAEIAVAMGVARGTVASTLAAAHHRLAHLLADEAACQSEVPHG